MWRSSAVRDLRHGSSARNPIAGNDARRQGRGRRAVLNVWVHLRGQNPSTWRLFFWGMLRTRTTSNERTQIVVRYEHELPAALRLEMGMYCCPAVQPTILEIFGPPDFGGLQGRRTLRRGSDIIRARWVNPWLSPRLNPIWCAKIGPTRPSTNSRRRLRPMKALPMSARSLRNSSLSC
jgi:hypothetical protein